MLDLGEDLEPNLFWKCTYYYLMELKKSLKGFLRINKKVKAEILEVFRVSEEATAGIDLMEEAEEWYEKAKALLPNK